MTDFLTDFQAVYGEDRLKQIIGYLQQHDLMDKYQACQADKQKLFDFGLHYGLIEIVAFLYCVVKLEVDLHQAIQGYHQVIESVVEFGEVAAVSQAQGHSKLVLTTSDSFTAKRAVCLAYLARMKKFSVYRQDQNRFLYQIKPAYIESYDLLNV